MYTYYLNCCRILRWHAHAYAEALSQRETLAARLLLYHVTASEYRAFLVLVWDRYSSRSVNNEVGSEETTR